MAELSYLADKSALVRIQSSPERETWDSRVDRGLVRVCTVTLLEIGYSARTHADLRSTLDQAPLARLPLELSTARAERRALAVQELLVARGQHRGVSIPDLLIAAVAETAGLTVLHVDQDFALIAEVTGQPVERLVTAQE